MLEYLLDEFGMLASLLDERNKLAQVSLFYWGKSWASLLFFGMLDMKLAPLVENMLDKTLASLMVFDLLAKMRAFSKVSR